MTSDSITAETVRNGRRDHQTRVRAYVRDCVMLAVVTSEDVAASLIDQAVALSRQPVLRTALD